MSGRLLAVVAVIVAVATSWAVARVRVWVEARRLLDYPNERSSHAVPTPRGGGIPIVIVVLAAMAAMLLVPGLKGGPEWWLWLAGGLVVALISWADDLWTLPFHIRLAVHVAAAAALATAVAWHDLELPIIGRVPLAWAGPLLTVVWVVGLTNVYNFMDGIDGIAGGQAVVAGLGFAVLGWIAGQPLIAAAGLLLASASTGFLAHNWHPARIFMGDVGSAFLGFAFAGLGVIGGASVPMLAAGSILLVWPFVFDTVFTLSRRLARGERVFEPHRSHLYQRLVITGLGHAFVAVLYVGLAAAGALLAIGLVTRIRGAELAVAILVPATASLLWLGVVRRERAHGSTMKKVG